MNKSRHLALMSGASKYGYGYVPLPAVETDLKLIREALHRRRFEV